MDKLVILIFALTMIMGCKEDLPPCPCLSFDQIPLYKACEPVADYSEARECAQEALLQQVYGTVKYPEQARVDSIEGRVVISFDIYTDGTIGNFLVVNDTIGYGLAQAAIEGARSLAEVGFCPAREQCEPVDFTWVMPVSFKLL